MNRLSQRGGMAPVYALIAAILALHLATNGQYGFHRDELATLDDARFLAWGYVAYPPLTPFFGRLSLDLFGVSVWGARLFPAIAQAISILLGALIARELGGGRAAQFTAALATAASPISLASGALLQYVTFDFLWWVLVFWCALRLVNTGDGRWGLAIGAALGLGMETKYTIGILAVALMLGVLLTENRRWLRRPWMWGGIALSLLIWLPNVLWQVQHGFITAEFLRSIHERDIRIGRTSGFFTDQLYLAANALSIPLWIAGLWWLLFRADGRKWRIAGIMVIATFVMFIVLQGRGYYVAALYVVLFAAGAVWLERHSRILIPVLALALLTAISITMPISPVGSRVSKTATKLNGDFVEELGWAELVQTVAKVHDSLPADERARAGILAGNYGEAGAIDLLGDAYHLPQAISGINSYWERGYPVPPPTTLIVLGLGEGPRSRLFEHCEVAAQLPNPFNIANEELTDHRDIYVCRGVKKPWIEWWPKFRYFG